MNAHIKEKVGIAALFTVCVLAIVFFGLMACSTPPSPATIADACDGIAILDTSFQAYAAAQPGKIDANGMNTEGTIMRDLGLPPGGGLPLKPTAGSPCDPNAPPLTSTTQLLADIAVDTLSLTSLIATWQK